MNPIQITAQTQLPRLCWLYHEGNSLRPPGWDHSTEYCQDLIPTPGHRFYLPDQPERPTCVPEADLNGRCRYCGKPLGVLAVCTCQFAQSMSVPSVPDAYATCVRHTPNGITVNGKPVESQRVNSSAPPAPDAGTPSERIVANAALLRLFKNEYHNSGDRHSDAMFARDYIAQLETELNAARAEVEKERHGTNVFIQECAKLRAEIERLTNLKESAEKYAAEFRKERDGAQSSLNRLHGEFSAFRDHAWEQQASLRLRLDASRPTAAQVEACANLAARDIASAATKFKGDYQLTFDAAKVAITRHFGTEKKV